MLDVKMTDVKLKDQFAGHEIAGRESQGDHFPDHMKFPDFSLTSPVEASKDYPVSSVYRYGQQSLFHINEKHGEAR